MKMRRHMIILSMLVITAVNVRAQCERPAAVENRILTDETSNLTFSDGATLKYKCARGYVSVRASDSRVITCTGNQWSELELQCKKKSCGSPGEISHGMYQYPENDGILFGATIRAVCNDGYQLVGRPERNCLENGWDGRAPECEVVKCLGPPSITDGTFSPVKDSYDYGETVSYSCRRGLNLIGSSEISCSGGGTFPPPPRCLLVSCDKPEILNAIKIEGKSPPYAYNNFVRYKCNEGYRMEGSDFLVCKEDGWNPPPPQCTEVICDALNIDHGDIVDRKTSYKYKMTIQYKCNTGHNMEGSGLLTCEENGWNRPPPKCTIVTCSPPPAINNGGFNLPKASYDYGETVTYSCEKGFKVYGDSTISCTEHGRFQPSPQCVEATCDALNIDHGDIVDRKTSYKYKMTIQYKCNTGYNMEGSGLLTCEENGWNRPPPKCTIVTCSPPPAINNGRFNLPKASYDYGETVTYSCEKGFKVYGDSTISCTEHGRFQPSPQCMEATCDAPQIKHGSTVEGKLTYGYDSSVRVQCDSVFEIDGPDYLTCKEEGWRPSPPECHINKWIYLLLFIPIIIFICCAYFLYKKFIKYQEPKANPEHNALVTMVSTTPRTENSSTKLNY